MRYIFHLLTTFFCVLCLNCFGQSESDNSVTHILSEAEYYIKDIENEYFTISKVEIDLVVSAESTFSPVKLIGGRTYNILVYGERNKIRDIDLRIHHKPSNDWIVILDENTSTNILKTTFKPEETAYYEFEILAQSFFSNYTSGRYFFIVSF